MTDLNKLQILQTQLNENLQQISALIFSAETFEQRFRIQQHEIQIEIQQYTQALQDAVTRIQVATVIPPTELEIPPTEPEVLEIPPTEAQVLEIESEISQTTKICQQLTQDVIVIQKRIPQIPKDVLPLVSDLQNLVNADMRHAVIKNLTRASMYFQNLDARLSDIHQALLNIPSPQLNCVQNLRNRMRPVEQQIDAQKTKYYVDYVTLVRQKMPDIRNEILDAATFHREVFESTLIDTPLDDTQITDFADVIDNFQLFLATEPTDDETIMFEFGKVVEVQVDVNKIKKDVKTLETMYPLSPTSIGYVQAYQTHRQQIKELESTAERVITRFIEQYKGKITNVQQKYVYIKTLLEVKFAYTILANIYIMFMPSPDLTQAQFQEVMLRLADWQDTMLSPFKLTEGLVPTGDLRDFRVGNYLQEKYYTRLQTLRELQNQIRIMWETIIGLAETESESESEGEFMESFFAK